MHKKLFIGCILMLCQLSVIAQDMPERSIEVLKQTVQKANTPKEKCTALLDLSLAYVLKPGEFTTDLDSAIALAQQAENINNRELHDKSTKAKVYFTFSNAYRENGDKVKGKAYCEKAVSLYKMLSLPAELGDTYLELAEYYDWLNEKEIITKRECFENALKQFRLTGNKLKQADALKNLGDLDNSTQNFGLALVELQEALSDYEAIHYRSLQGTYDLLGLAYNNLGDFATAIKYGQLAVKAAQEVNDTTLQLCTIYYRLAMSYDMWNRNHGTEALEYMQKALPIALKYNDQRSIMIVLTGLCNTLCNLKRPAEAISLIERYGNRIKAEDNADSIYIYSYYGNVYVDAKQFDKARQYIDYLVATVPITTKLMDILPELAYRVLVRYFIATHQNNAAEKYAAANVAYCLANSQPAVRAIAYRYKANADSASGDFKSAFINHQLYADLKDSMFNENKSFQFAQMQVALETEKKDNDLKLLQSQSEVKDAEIKTASLVRNIIIGAALLALLILYTGYRFKQRSNAKLQTQQFEINKQNKILETTVAEKNELLTEKERLVKEIHHRVKNNLQIVISLLNTQSNYLDNNAAIEAIAESRHRMEVISLIHQKLYKSDNTTIVHMQTYINELIEYLEASFTSTNISFKTRIDDLELDIGQAIPVGLILNEAITNAMKYAFINKQEGIIFITMKTVGEDTILLDIKDNGNGLPEGFDISKSSSMGMRLIEGLAKQIDGSLVIESKGGVSVCVSFKKETIAVPDPRNFIV